MQGRRLGGGAAACRGRRARGMPRPAPPCPVRTSNQCSPLPCPAPQQFIIRPDCRAAAAAAPSTAAAPPPCRRRRGGQYHIVSAAPHPSPAAGHQRSAHRGGGAARCRGRARPVIPARERCRHGHGHRRGCGAAHRDPQPQGARECGPRTLHVQHMHNARRTCNCTCSACAHAPATHAHALRQPQDAATPWTRTVHHPSPPPPRARTQEYTRKKIADFLHSHTAYELIPESGKVVVLDVDLPVRQAFHALHEQVGPGLDAPDRVA